MSKKITHKYFDEVYWMKPHTKSGYSPQEGYTRDEYAPGATAEFLTKLFGTEGKWLEAGCAFGWVVERLLMDHGVDTYGFDISKYSIKNAPKEIDFAIKQADGLKVTEYPVAAFDVIYSIETAEHIHQDDVPAWLSNLYKWMKPGGKLFMTICVGNNNLRGLDDIDLSHQTLQPRQWWENELLKVGFLHDGEKYAEAVKTTLEHSDIADPFNARNYFQWHIFVWRKPQ